MPSARSQSACAIAGASVRPNARAACASCSTHDVGGDVLLARRVERSAAAFVRAVRAQPAAASRELGRRRRRSRSTSTKPCRTHALARAPTTRRCPRGIGTARVHRPATASAPGVDRRPERAPRRSRRSRRARRALRASASPSHSAMPNGRLSSSSLASTTASPAASAGSSSSAANTGPAPRAGTGWSSSRAARRTGRAPRRPVRAARRCALLGAQRGGALDEHVAQRPQALGRGAQHLAREAAVARAGFDHEERIGLVERVPAAGRAHARRTRRTADRPRGW